MIGSLNLNGGRDRLIRAMIRELFKHKIIDVVFLQETHSDQANERVGSLVERNFFL